MKKFGLIALGILAAIVALANAGSIVALALSALVAYAGFHYWQKSSSALGKLFWGAVLVIGLLTAISNIPAFLGLIAIIAVLYIWNKIKYLENSTPIQQNGDPFTNFEKQWNEISK